MCGDVICDPACGTSGFLVAAGEYLKEKYLEDIFYDKWKKVLLSDVLSETITGE